MCHLRVKYLNVVYATSRRGARHRLQLNTAKSELIWFGSRQMLEKISDSDLTLNTGTTVIRPVKSVHDLGVHLDSELTMKPTSRK